MRRTIILTTAALTLLAGCSDLPVFRTSGGGGASGGGGGGGGGAAPVLVEPERAPAGSVSNVPAPGTTVVAPPRAVTSTVGALDRVSEAEKAQARNVAATTAGAELGSETVGLGDPAEAGLWVKTGLVSAERQGTVAAAGGESVAVTLRPLGGAGGAQISLSALQALGLPLIGLHPVTLSGT